MRCAYVVSYDISDPKRLRQVFKTMLGWGEHLQLSVFRCELSRRDRVRMSASLDKLIHHGEDQVLIVNLGPVPGRAERAIDAIGRAYAPRARTALVV